LFNAFDTTKSGLIDITAIQHILEKLGIKIDPPVAAVLLRRYDADKKGKLKFEEFAELYVTVLNLLKFFQASDTNKNGTLDSKEIAAIIPQLKLKISSKSVVSILKLFDEDGTGSSSFQEYLSLVFFLNELDFQFENYLGAIPDYNYDWLVPLLGPQNVKKVPDVAKKLKEWKDKKRAVTFEEFVELIVKTLEVNVFVRFFTGKKQNAPKVDVVRDKFRIQPPKKRIVVAPPPPIAAEKVARKLEELNIVPEKKQIWSDSNFALNASVLPPEVIEDIQSWKRPIELNDKAALFVKGVDDGDVIQGGLGDCWFLSALAIITTSTENYINQLFTIEKPEIGYYQCKFYKNGAWHTVDIDDKLPCSDRGLFFAKCKDPSEFWVPLLEKAYAKLHGSYHALEQGNIADGLRDLTGEAVEILLIDDPNFIKKNVNLWEVLLRNIKESFLMGCAKEAANVKAESESEFGILVNHAYSIIDVQEIQGNRLLRIRNPWGRGEWTGPWGDNTKEWTPALLKHFEYDFANDGTFFISFDDFVQHYNRIYVLRLYTDAEGEVWTKSSIFGEFKGESAGGCTAYPTWIGNPQYSLVATNPTKVFINLSQPDLRFATKKNPGVSGVAYEPIGIVILKDDNIAFKKTAYKVEERFAASQFGGVRDMSLEFTAQPGNYIILPSTYNPGVEFRFELEVYTQFKVPIQEITHVLPSKTIKSGWKGNTAGGCVNNPTFLNNPQFLLELEKPGSVIANLRQELGPKDKPESIGIYVFTNTTPTRVEIKPPAAERVVNAKDFPDVAVVEEHFQANAGVHYIVMPTTFDPFTRDFVITVSSPDSQIKTFSLL